MATNRQTSSKRLIIPTQQSFNRFAEAANKVLGGSPRLSARGWGGAARTEVLVRNLTNTDIGFNKIIGLDDCRFKTGEDLFGMIDNPVFDSITTQALDTEHFASWGITSHPITAFEHGLVVVAGITACEVNVTDTDHLFCDVFNSTDGKDRLTSATAGSARILNRPASTGNQSCVVQLGVHSGLLYGSLQADLAKGGSSTISNPTATVYDDNWLNTGTELVSGTKVVCHFGTMGGEGRWIVHSASACESAA